MKIPSFKKIQHDSLDLSTLLGIFYASNMHPNPGFYKYYWWVFTSDSPVDGTEFLAEKYRVTTAEYLRIVRECHANNKPYWVYNKRLRRKDV